MALCPLWFGNFLDSTPLPGSKMVDGVTYGWSPVGAEFCVESAVQGMDVIHLGQLLSPRYLDLASTLESHLLF